MGYEKSSKRVVSRRDFLRIGGVGAGAVLLAACGNTGTTTTPATGTTATGGDTAAGATSAPAPTSVAATGEQTTITWWNTYSSETVKSLVPRMMDEFASLNPNIKVEYELTGGAPGGGNFSEVLLARIASGNPPDIATIYTAPAEYASRGSLTEIDQYMASAQWAKPDAYYPAPLGSCQWQGKTYGLPSSAGPTGVFYNTDMFKELGVSTARADFPKTWQEFKELAAKFVVKEGDLFSRVGVVPFGQSWFYPIWSGNNGGHIFDVENNRYDLVSDANEEWLNTWLGWLDDQLGGSYENLSISGGFVGAYSDQGFWQKKAAMCFDGSWVSTDAAIPFNWDVAPMPYGPKATSSRSGFYPNWWVMPKGTQHPAEAFKLLEYITTKGWEIWYRGIMDTPAWKDFPKDIVTTKLTELIGDERAKDVTEFFADYLNTALPMWNSPIESFATDTSVAMVEKVLNKASTPREALEEAQGILQAKLEETLKTS